MMSRPMFSIIVPTYNRSRLLNKVIEDVLEQSISEWELVIVDDGSTDDTKEMISAIEDDRIKYVYQENQGECEARNTGLSIANGEWICYVDSDDTITNDYLSTFAEMMENGCKIYCAGVKLWWPDNEKEIKYIPAADKGGLVEQYLNGHYNLMPFCLHSTTAKSKSFEKGVVYGGDFQYLLPILLEENIKSTTKVTSAVVAHNGRIVSRIFQDYEMGYDQMIHSTVNSIESYEIKIKEYVGEKKYNEIVYTKKKNFILGTADLNLSGGLSLMKKSGLSSTSLRTSIILQRIKGIVKKILN